MKKTLLFFLLLTTYINAQEYFPKNDGVSNKNNNYTAFTNAKIYISPTQVIDRGTLLIKNDQIVTASKSVNLPKNTVVIDLEGKSIYPSFIDIYSDFGTTALQQVKSSGQPQYDTKRAGYYWNEHVRPEQKVIQSFKFDKKKAEELRKLGFGTVNTHLQDGIFRGTGALVTLNSKVSDNFRILDQQSAQYLSFKKSKQSAQIYPSSLMGSIALIQQVYLDEQWYSQGLSKVNDLSLEALKQQKNLVQIFAAGNKGNVLRAHKIGQEFGIDYTILGGGDEYEIIDQIKATQSNFILPINFPKAYDVENTTESHYIQLGDMRDWNQAPTNPKVFQENNISFALTTFGHKKLSDFKTHLNKARAYGLTDTQALAALTTKPAQFIKKSNTLGTLEKDKLANFIICSGNIFDQHTIIYENWIQGKSHVIHDLNLKNILGEYILNIDNTKYQVDITGTLIKPKLSVKKDSIKLQSKINYKYNWLDIQILNKESDMPIRLSALVTQSSKITGDAITNQGQKKTFIATRVSSSDQQNPKNNNSQGTPNIVPLTYPNIAYGFKEKPKAQTILFKNATVWTNEKDGILKNTDVLIKDGKISKIGPNLKSNRALVIDATDKHLTSGIIDEHAHIATISTNEVGQNSTAEVSMANALNNEDINIYRALAGGVTQAQILHGSANPIGGQSAIIKLKWGETSDNLIDPKAPKFIKFALGENVKQSNWNSKVRFPQTRMGVEQVYIDYFQRAKEYDLIKKSGQPYRKDLEMETLAEILNKERFISCHSYVQSEINMLMKVAEKFNFNINTFTHILEGYKVADKMKSHGVGGSTFSDWWAYKYEVNDAIPYNAALMHQAGVVTAINSDDAEMMRRLNQEAAKTIKYGGVSEEDAWKFVTLNPAKLLHIDDHVGSIKVGKDADLVLWSNHPLSVNTKAEKTIIEGKIYFDIERNQIMQNNIEKEKNILINQMLNEKFEGKPTQKAKKKLNLTNHCDTI